MARVNSIYRDWRSGTDGDDSIRTEQVQKDVKYIKEELGRPALHFNANIKDVNDAWVQGLNDVRMLKQQLKDRRHYTEQQKEVLIQGIKDANSLVEQLGKQVQKNISNECEDYEEEQWESASKKLMYGRKKTGSRNAEDTTYIDKDIHTSRIKSAVTIMLSKLAEDSTGFDYEGDEFWDIDRLMQRRYTKAQLKHCKLDKDKETVAFLIDTSPSCEKMSRIYSKLVSAVVKRGDVTLIKAPNASLQYYYDRKTGDWVRYNFKHDSEDEEVSNWQTVLAGRKVIFFGDSDGDGIVSKSSRFCSIHHFFGEFYETLEDFMTFWTFNSYRGKIYRCNDVGDFLQAISKIK